MRLIDADELACGYGEEERQKYGNDFDGGVLFALDFLSENSPTVDAVPVVRCRECKHADEYCHCSFANWWPDAMDYCSHGERKGGDE